MNEERLQAIEDALAPIMKGPLPEFYAPTSVRTLAFKAIPELIAEVRRLRARAEKAERARDELKTRRAVLLAGVGQTWGDVARPVRRWLAGYLDPHEYDNRTTEENVVWLGAKLIEVCEGFEADLKVMRRQG